MLVVIMGKCPIANIKSQPQYVLSSFVKNQAMRFFTIAARRSLIIGLLSIVSVLILCTIQVLFAFCPQLRTHYSWYREYADFADRMATGGGRIATGLAINLPESVILDFLGKPTVQDRSIDLPDSPWRQISVSKWIIAHADRNLLYKLNNGETAIFSIKNHICSYAHILSHDDLSAYQEWKVDRIAAFSNGKSEEQIISEFGKPTSRSPLNVHSGYYIIGPESSAPSEGFAAEEDWTYSTGPTTCVSLTMKNHHCTNTSRPLVMMDDFDLHPRLFDLQLWRLRRYLPQNFLN